MYFLLAIHPVIPIAIIVVAGAGGVGLYGLLSGWWNGDKDQPGPTPDPTPDDAEDDDGDGNGAAPVTGYICDRTGMASDAARYDSPEPVIADFRMLGFDVTDNLKSSKSKSEIKRAQRMFRELELPGMKGASDKYIDAIVGGCTLISLAAAMEMHGAGTWPGGTEQD